MKYLGQHDRYACAAIVFINAFKWMGINTTGKHLGDLKKMMGTKPFVGTTRSLLHWMAKCCGFTQVRKPTIESMDAELIAGNALIVDTRHPNRRKGHVYLIVRRTDRYFVCVNINTGETVSRVSKKTVARLDFREPRVYRVKPLEVGPNMIFRAARAA